MAISGRNQSRSLSRCLSLPAVCLLLWGCGGGAPDAKSPQAEKAQPSGEPKAVQVSDDAKKGFDAALQAMVAHDKANDWADATCASVAKMFVDAAAVQKSESKHNFPEALYNGGLAYQRCHKDSEAKVEFAEALNLDPKFHRARVQIALYDYREKGDAALESTIGQLKQAVTDAQFQNVEALVNLAMLQMKRGATESDTDGANDLDRAKKNLQRALAVDDGFQPALNQLGLYYLELAKSKAGRKTKSKASTFGKTKRVDIQQLELAALVCSQAIRKNPNYAPIHNTAGLIQVELQNINSAVQEFQSATKIDPTFFEAQMNFAAVNLSFRGFKAAETAYRAALQIRPNDCDAHLGLALAARGQIDDSSFDKRVAEAQSELDQVKKLCPERPEVLYNEAILTQEFKAKGGGNNAVPTLEVAASQFEGFVAKAGGAAEYADAVKRARDRSQDIRDTVKFIKEGQSQAAIDAARQEKEQSEAAPPAGDAAPASEPAKP